MIRMTLKQCAGRERNRIYLIWMRLCYQSWGILPSHGYFLGHLIMRVNFTSHVVPNRNQIKIGALSRPSEQLVVHKWTF